MAISPTKLRRAVDRAGPLGIALALGVLLVASSSLSYRDSRRAAALVAERQGVGLMHRLDSVVERHPDRQALLAALEINRALGLRYAALVDHGAVIIEAGQAELAGASAPMGGLVSRPGRVRMTGPGGPGGPGGPPPFDRRFGEGPPPGPPPGFGMFDGRPPPPPHGPRIGRLVIEFEPIGSEEAVHRALAVLWLSSGAAVLLTAAALILAAKARGAERAEAQLAAHRHLAHLGEMSAVLAHEIRNPLAALKGHAQLLAERATDDETAGRVARVVDGAVRLERLTNDLLAFARDGALHRAPADPGAVLERAIRATAPARIDRVIDHAPATFSLDAARIEEVLVNLLENALAVTPPEARVTATATAVGGELLFTVEDHGPGVPAADRAQIFEPFHTTKTRGTGLGLAIAKRIVDLHGGHIEIRDAAPGGAIFCVHLPGETR